LWNIPPLLGASFLLGYEGKELRMNGGLIYRDSFSRLARRFREEGRSGIAEEISRWHYGHRESLAQLISPESQRRLEKVVEALRGAQNPNELQGAVEKFRSALRDLQEEIAGAIPERAGELRSVSEAVQELVQRVLGVEAPFEPDVYAEIRARNIPKFPKEQRSVSKKDRIDPLEFLRLHYGEFLAYFGASRNRISQLHLGEIDPDLLTSVRNRVNYLVRKQGWKTELREIIPPYSGLLTEQLEAVPRDQVLSKARLGMTLKARERRAKKDSSR
jgi:hypothetical protein